MIPSSFSSPFPTFFPCTSHPLFSLHFLSFLFLSQLLGQPDSWLDDGRSVGVLDGVTIHTPGHTPGSCCFYFDKSRILFSGDTLMRGKHTGGGDGTMVATVDDIADSLTWHMDSLSFLSVYHCYLFARQFPLHSILPCGRYGGSHGLARRERGRSQAVHPDSFVHPPGRRDCDLRSRT